MFILNIASARATSIQNNLFCKKSKKYIYLLKPHCNEWGFSKKNLFDVDQSGFLKWTTISRYLG